MFTLAEKEIIDILWCFPYAMEEKKSSGQVQF